MGGGGHEEAGCPGWLSRIHAVFSVTGAVFTVILLVWLAKQLGKRRTKSSSTVTGLPSLGGVVSVCVALYYSLFMSRLQSSPAAVLSVYGQHSLHREKLLPHLQPRHLDRSRQAGDLRCEWLSTEVGLASTASVS